MLQSVVIFSINTFFCKASKDEILIATMDYRTRYLFNIYGEAQYTNTFRGNFYKSNLDLKENSKYFLSSLSKFIIIKIIYILQV